MAELPSANVTIDDEAGAFAGGTGYLVVMGCAELNADATPRVFSSTKSLIAQHGYAQGVDYASMHFEEARKPVIYVGLPAATAGVSGSFDTTGVTGTCAITVAAGSNGFLEEVSGSVTVVDGGTVGADLITFSLSLDGGRTSKLIRLGTASSYTIPYVGIVLNFGAGTLVADDVMTFRTTAPMWDSAGLLAGRTALAAQLKLARSWLVVGDLPNSTFAGHVTTQVNAYETANQRFVYARAAIKDRSPLALAAKNRKKMVGDPQLTFAEVGATGDTITRATGSWITDGFAVGDVVTVSGSVSNNVTGRIASLSATVLTFDTTDLANEGPVSGVTIVGSASYTFLEVGASGDTITRSSGSWLNDGFAVGDTVVITGTASNNVTGAIAALSATVLTFGTTDLANEEIRSDLVTIVKSQSMAAYVAAKDAAFASVDDQKRIDLSLGRASKASPITAWQLRRPAAWAASLREYQHDLHIPSWRKADGPVDGWDMMNEAGTVVEFDERSDGGALAGRFTCFRTYGNGPIGSFVALSLTRATEGSLLSRTHNMSVANHACSVVQAETENAIGQVLQLNSDGTGTDASLSLIEARVNSALQIALLQQGSEGPRASSAVWSASRSDVLNIPAAELTGVLDLRLNGTLEKISTRVRIQTAG